MSAARVAALAMAGVASCAGPTDLQKACEEIARAPAVWTLDKAKNALGSPAAEQVRRREAWTWPEYCVAEVDLEIFKIVSVDAPDSAPSSCWTIKDELAAAEGQLDVSRAVALLGGEPLGKSTVESSRTLVWLDADLEGFLCRVRFDWASGVGQGAVYARRPARGVGYFE